MEVMQYSDGSMISEVLSAGRLYPNLNAYEYMGYKRGFREFEGDVRTAAKSFYALGIRHGDRVMLSLPNVPQAVILFYALNLVGAVACMTHPLSSAEELSELLNKAKPRIFVTLYRFYEKFKPVLDKYGPEYTVLTGPGDALPMPLARLFALTDKCPPRKAGILRYNEFLRRGRKLTTQIDVELGRDMSYEYKGRADDVAAVLYSGGTSGKTKGILLTNLNFNAQAQLTAEAGDCMIPRTKMLCVMPIFHGFGLGVCIHTALTHGVTCLLVPRFTVKAYARLLKKRRPHYIAGVPTLFEALLRLPKTNDLDLSMLLGVFSGGDSMTPELKRRFDAFLFAHGARVPVREGYGLTESVTACCLTPKGRAREGSIGVPFRDMLFKIVRVEDDAGTTRELPHGQTGEICISGPTVMRGYDGDEEETKTTLRRHPDGQLWLHTGDLGETDDDGFIYFKGRIKRMIVSSGYSVYPYHVENILQKHKLVRECCVVGVPDDYRMQKVKAYIVLEIRAGNKNAALEDIRKYSREALSPHNRPREFEIVRELPKTLVGKIDYTKLQK